MALRDQIIPYIQGNPLVPEVGSRPTGHLASPRFAQWPHFSDEETAAVCAVLTSGKVNRWTGEQNVAFEQEFAAVCQMPHAIAVANGTLALELILFAYDIGPGDEVIVPCRTFIASASCAVMRGARPVVADVDPVSQNLTAATIAPLINERTKAIICVHHAGWPCDMDPILALAHPRGIKVIEDCAQSHGAEYKGRPAGSIGDMSAFSFCQDKIMTTGGEGGMVLTRDAALYRKMWYYKDHGKSYEAVYERKHAPGFRWLHEDFGTNWRLLELQAIIGRIQLKKLPEWTQIRTRHARQLNDAFRHTPGLRVTQPGPEVRHAYYKYYALIEPELLKADWSPARIYDAVSAKGIPCMPGTCWNISQEKAFRSRGWDVPEAQLPGAARLRDTSLLLLVHPTLLEEDILRSIEAVQAVMKEAVR